MQQSPISFCLIIKQQSPNSPPHRCAVDAEVSKYVGEAYPKGVCSVFCTSGKDVEEPGSDFELVVVISAARHSPQNFWWALNSVFDCSYLLFFLGNCMWLVVVYDCNNWTL